MNLPPADKTDKTDKTPAALRTARREAVYAKVLRVAVEAIKEGEDFRPESVAELLKQLVAGEPLMINDLRRIEAAVAQAKRKRGRPVGSGAKHERNAVRYAIYRTSRFRLAAYRNPTSQHHTTKSDAIAEAMRQCGFNRVATYEAVAAEMRRERPALRRHFEEMAELGAQFAARQDEAMQAALSELHPDFRARLLTSMQKFSSGNPFRKLDDN